MRERRASDWKVDLAQRHPIEAQVFMTDPARDPADEPLSKAAAAKSPVLLGERTGLQRVFTMLFLPVLPWG